MVFVAAEPDIPSVPFLFGGQSGRHLVGLLALVFCLRQFWKDDCLPEALVLLLFTANFFQWAVTPQSGLYYYYYYPCVMIFGVAIAVALRSLPARSLRHANQPSFPGLRLPSSSCGVIRRWRIWITMGLHLRMLVVGGLGSHRHLLDGAVWSSLRRK